MGPMISVITTTWNRAKYLARVHAGLACQTFGNIEWIVADDGSTDGTENVVRNLVAYSDFPVVYIRASIHVGKIRMDNEAVRQARGEFILWCDSDDYFLPHALKTFIDAWQSIPMAARDNYIGVTALCATESGILNSAVGKRREFDSTWNELASMREIPADASLFIRADQLKRHRFPEVDFVIPESVVWSALGNLKTRVLPIVVKNIEYLAENGISFSPGMKYNRGRAYALAATIRNSGGMKGSLARRAWQITTFVRYCIHGDIKPRAASQLWGQNSSRLFLLSCIFPAILLSLKDVLQQKVVKTHIEFERAIHNTKIDVYHL